MVSFCRFVQRTTARKNLFITSSNGIYCRNYEKKKKKKKKKKKDIISVTFKPQTFFAMWLFNLTEIDHN
jgi:hypothetical protein